MKPIDHYKVLAFDCDGVLLNSNSLKTDAFYAVTLKYGEDVADRFRKYHASNGGISRYKKFDYFFESILAREAGVGEKEQLLTNYANEVLEKLLVCEVVQGLHDLRLATENADWMVASGGDQCELQQVFQARGLDKLFNIGVFGSPTTKDDILKTVVNTGVDPSRLLVIGDSAFDYRAAQSVGADFVFAAYWTEMPQWQDFTARNSLRYLSCLSDITASEGSFSGAGISPVKNLNG